MPHKHFCTSTFRVKSSTDHSAPPVFCLEANSNAFLGLRIHLRVQWDLTGSDVVISHTPCKGVRMFYFPDRTFPRWVFSQNGCSPRDISQTRCFLNIK